MVVPDKDQKTKMSDSSDSEVKIEESWEIPDISAGSSMNSRIQEISVSHSETSEQIGLKSPTDN